MRVSSRIHSRGAYSGVYACPQQRAGEEPDVRDDVWSLAVIWYQLLIGDLKASAPSGRRWKATLEGRGVSARHVELLEDCFELERGHRVKSVAEFLVRVEAIPAIKRETNSEPEVKVVQPERKLVIPQQPTQLELPDSFTNSVGMEFRLIPAGSFLMGSPDPDPDAYDDEKPRHRVEIPEPFYMQTTTVTQEQEWEYACRAGSTTRYCYGDDTSQLASFAWLSQNTHGVDKPYAQVVGGKKPNRWELYDMHGNVWEWCENLYTQYQADVGESSDRVVRGGCWGYGARLVRSAFRFHSQPGDRDINLGFRCLSSSQP